MQLDGQFASNALLLRVLCRRTTISVDERPFERPQRCFLVAPPKSRPHPSLRGRAMSADAAPVVEMPQPVRRHKLRIWPAVILLLLMLGAKVAQALLLTESAPSLPLFMTFVFGPVVCCGVIALWWLFFSRAPWSDRILGLVGALVLGVVGFFLSDRSMHGMPFMVYAVPDAVMALTVALLVLSLWSPRAGTVAALVAGRSLWATGTRSATTACGEISSRPCIGAGRRPPRMRSSPA